MSARTLSRCYRSTVCWRRRPAGRSRHRRCSSIPVSESSPVTCRRSADTAKGPDGRLAMRYLTLGPGGPVVSAIGLTARSFLDERGRPDATVVHTMLGDTSGVNLIDLTGGETAEPLIG